jgi:hypothetical protein
MLSCLEFSAARSFRESSQLSPGLVLFVSVSFLSRTLHVCVNGLIASLVFSHFIKWVEAMLWASVLGMAPRGISGSSKGKNADNALNLGCELLEHLTRG